MILKDVLADKRKRNKSSIHWYRDCLYKGRQEAKGNSESKNLLPIACFS